MTITNEIEDFLNNHFSPPHVKGGIKQKVIRDTINGTKRFEGYEIEVLDLPIVQRLRRIHQNGFAYLVYPGCRHSRFEHSLGVSIIAERMIKAIITKPEKHDLFSNNDLIEIKLASILHDVGHGFFSHVSEKIMKLNDDYINEKKKFVDIDPSPHELLSYLITKSKYMKDFFSDLNIKYSKNINPENVANYIIGKVDNPAENKFKANVLCGAFDADKLDYIRRDSYFSGLGLVLDIDRMLYTIDVKIPICTEDYKSKKANDDVKLDSLPRQIICNVSSVGVFEQLIFNKMMLHSMMYHHHKIRAAECLLINLWEYIKNNPEKELLSIKYLDSEGKGKIESLHFEKLTDFLKATDYDILSYNNYANDKNILKICADLRERNLPYRCVILSNQTLTKDNFKISNFIGGNFYSLKEQLEFKNDLIDTYNTIFNPVDKMSEIWVDIPKIMTINEPKHFFVEITEKDFKRIVDLFKVDQWITSFSENKYMGLILSRKDPTIQENVLKATKELLKEVHNVELNDMAQKLAKIK